MKTLALLGTVSACAALLAISCGDDDDNGGGGTGGTDAGAGTGGTAGSGTGGAATGGATTGGAAGSGGGGTGASGGTGGMDAGGMDAGAFTSLCGGLTGTELETCGEYLVRRVAICADCHTPRLPTGALDETMLLAGNAQFADMDPSDPAAGLLPTRNLTQLQSWTDDEIKDAFLRGQRSAAHGGAIFPIMPYPTYANMAPEDADAIVAYIRSLAPITNVIPDRQVALPPGVPVAPFPADSIPDPVLAPTSPNYAAAMRGKYLAGNVGACMECHTERQAPPNMFSLDTAKLFAGGEEFPRELLGLPPVFPAVIYSRNITPDDSGISGWTATMVRNALKDGVDEDGQGLCPPMPAGPMGAFGGLTDEDALAIGHYITNLAPIANPADGGVIPECVPPSGPPPVVDGGTDGGGADASADGSMDAGPG